MTVYEFVQQNRVEVVFNKAGYYDCYINFKEDDKPWGRGPNALDALDNGVANYTHSLNHGPQNLQDSKVENEKLRLFLSKDALFIWYFYAKKYNKTRIVNYYEQLATQTHPNYLNIIRFMYDKIQEAIKNPETKIDDTYLALNNVFIQALVYHESLAEERYENNKIISEMRSSLGEEEKIAFDKIQETIVEIEKEIHKIIKEENG